MIDIVGLYINYGKVAAVRDLHMTVERGEIVGLIGPNGAGKTTTLGAICGLITPVRGGVSFEGTSIIGRKPEEVVRLGIALVPEGRHIFGTLTVQENLVLGGTPRRDRHNLRGDIDAVMDRFPMLAQNATASAWRLSGGQQQQLAIARALLSRPRLLLLDEPSLGLDPITINTVFALIGELRAEGVTVLLVEQNASKTVHLADRCYVMSTGEVQMHGTREELLATADFEAMYLGDGSRPVRRTDTLEVSTLKANPLAGGPNG